MYFTWWFICGHSKFLLSWLIVCWTLNKIWIKINNSCQENAVFYVVCKISDICSGFNLSNLSHSPSLPPGTLRGKCCRWRHLNGSRGRGDVHMSPWPQVPGWKQNGFCRMSHNSPLESNSIPHMSKLVHFVNIACNLFFYTRFKFEKSSVPLLVHTFVISVTFNRHKHFHMKIISPTSHWCYFVSHNRVKRRALSVPNISQKSGKVNTSHLIVMASQITCNPNVC